MSCGAWRPKVRPARVAPSGKGGVSKKVAVVQSNYVPWKGYFDLIHAVDEFILFDCVQYTRRDWRNRNLIKTKDGPAWLTIPVKASGKYLAPIEAIEVDGQKWRERHWQLLSSSYARAPHFRDYAPRFEALYATRDDVRLSLVNRSFLEEVCAILNIRTRLSWATEYDLVEGKTERIVSLCRQAGGSVYVSGPAAREYLEPQKFEAAGIELRFFDYHGYSEYPQCHPPFRHDVSVLDLLFNAGPHASSFMLTFGQGAGDLP
jgi:WbqC-like protein family